MNNLSKEELQALLNKTRKEFVEIRLKLSKAPISEHGKFLREAESLENKINEIKAVAKKSGLIIN
jgi:hypothetical protein